jgi:hypothetical protein
LSRLGVTRAMKAMWKRVVLVVVGAYVLFAVAWSLQYPFDASSIAERNGFYAGKIGLAVLGVWMIVRGWRPRPPAGSG